MLIIYLFKIIFLSDFYFQKLKFQTKIKTYEIHTLFIIQGLTI